MNLSAAAPAYHITDGCAMLYDPAVIARPCAALFDPLVYGEAAQTVAQGGRQAAWFVSLDDDVQAVLRHYRRGGLMARLGRRHYFWLGQARTRSFAEFRLTYAMYAQGLPVPRPLAAACWRSGWHYRAAILIERIAQAQTLASVLDEPVEQAVSQAIVRLHRAGVWHADLNAYNILLDANGQVWLIDFDRGRRGALTAQARQNNLARLRRSLEKIAGERGLAVWQRINAAYQAGWEDTLLA